MTGLGLAGLVQVILVLDRVIGVIQIPTIGLIDLMRVILGINIILLISLGYVWGANAWRFRSKHTMGLFVFSILLLAENALAFYLFVFHNVLSGWISNPAFVPLIAQYAMLSIRALEFCGLVFLTWVTWD
jgi:hypothetical protein